MEDEQMENRRIQKWKKGDGMEEKMNFFPFCPSLSLSILDVTEEKKEVAYLVVLKLRVRFAINQAIHTRSCLEISHASCLLQSSASKREH